MKQTVRLTLVLGGTCLLAALILAGGNLITLGPRAQAETRERQRNLRLVLPEFRNDPTSESIGVAAGGTGAGEAGQVTFYPARDAAQGGRLIGFAAEATSRQGYGGGVTVLAGLTPAGSLLQVMVTSHSETPGLGTRVTDRVRTRYLWQAFSTTVESGLPPSAHLDQYRDRAAADVASADFRLVKSQAEVNARTVQAVSGATVSSNAVAAAVKLICTAFAEHRAELPKE
jgi:electron transport complex protein RnfG